MTACWQEPAPRHGEGICFQHRATGRHKNGVSTKNHIGIRLHNEDDNTSRRDAQKTKADYPNKAGMHPACCPS
ncbi:MAG: hypothetical protein NVS4B8_04500 [Herpetosiphon sp.]